MKPFLSLIGACLFCSVVLAAAPATSTAPATGPKNEQGLTATLTGKGVYTIDAAHMGPEYREMLKVRLGRGFRGDAAPVPPAVELTLQITNATDKDVTINLGGDDSRLDLKLEGPGAVTIQNAVAMTREFRIGKPVTIAAGKTHEIKIDSLSFGMRGIEKSAFWTEPGEYTLTVAQVYGMGEKQGKVESNGMKTTVKAATPAGK